MKRFSNGKGTGSGSSGPRSDKRSEDDREVRFLIVPPGRIVAATGGEASQRPKDR